jgi:hypothetical protein
MSRILERGSEEETGYGRLAAGHAKPKAAASAGETDEERGAAANCAQAGGGAFADTKEQVKLDRDDLDFSFAVEVHYHRARQAFLAGTHRWLMFGTILSGASAVAPFAHAAFGLIAAALAAADIALDLTGRAQVHGDMVRKYLQLVADLASADWDPDKVTKIRRDWFSLSAEEPALYRYAQFIAHNEAIQSLGCDAAPVPLTFWQRFRANFWRS